MIYRLKEGFGPPDQYLGANVEKVQLEDGRVFWSTNCVDYLKSAIENLYNTLGENKTAIKNCGMGVGHTHPDSGQNYMSLKNWERNLPIGIRRWRVQKNVRKTGKMNIEIFYVVSVRMSVEIILEDQKVGRYGPDRNQGHLFFVCIVLPMPTKPRLILTIVFLNLGIRAHKKVSIWEYRFH